MCSSYNSPESVRTEVNMQKRVLEIFIEVSFYLWLGTNLDICQVRFPEAGQKQLPWYYELNNSQSLGDTGEHSHSIQLGETSLNTQGIGKDPKKVTPQI